MCTHYSAVFVGCASALGWVARSVVIDHHCIAEIWVDDLQKCKGATIHGVASIDR